MTWPLSIPLNWECYGPKQRSIFFLEILNNSFRALSSIIIISRKHHARWSQKHHFLTGCSLGRSAAGSADAGQQPRPGGAAQEADAGRGWALSTSGGRQPTTVTSHNIKIQEGVIKNFISLQSVVILLILWNVIPNKVNFRLGIFFLKSSHLKMNRH